MAKAKVDYLGKIITQVQTVALLTLADQAALALDQITISEDFRILKSEICAGIINLDDDENVQGLLFGIANGELSDAEIAQAITSQGPLDRNDRLAAERASRWVKILSTAEVMFQGHNSGRTTIDAIFKNQNGGPIIESKDRWTYSDPEGWVFFVFNNSGTALATGATARMTAKHFGVWVT